MIKVSAEFLMVDMTNFLIKIILDLTIFTLQCTPYEKIQFTLSIIPYN